MDRFVTRMGDGYLTEMSRDEIKADLEEGTQDAARKGKIPPLGEDELTRLLEICTIPSKFVSVERGNEIILSSDGGTMEIPRLGIPGRLTAVQIWERVIGADTAELGYLDYSYKAVKPIVHEEQRDLEDILMSTVLPLFYGAMPNLGLYTQPDGPVPNPTELLPMGKIAEARESQEEAMEYAVRDIVYVAGRMYESGADGVDLDTAGAAGDADFLAALKAIESLKEKYPDICIMLGASGETVLGMHGELYYDDIRVAGLRPHEQARLAQKAGATIFGPAVNTNTSKSFPWNLARAVTFTKACVEEVDIPIHTNVGMGVGGVPMHHRPCPDVVSRVSTALAEVGRLDGL